MERIKVVSQGTSVEGECFTNFVQMSTNDFEMLLQMVAPKTSLKDTKYRKAISPLTRLANTLASGDSYMSLRISKQIIPHTDTLVFSLLDGKHIHMKDCLQTLSKLLENFFSKQAVKSLQALLPTMFPGVDSPLEKWHSTD